MLVTTKITIDLAQPTTADQVYAVQGDGQTRGVEISLLENGKPWTVPDGAEAAVTYTKPDRTTGIYNKLPDGSDAVIVNGSTVTAVMSAQIVESSGKVKVAVVFLDSMMNRLTSFPFYVNVRSADYTVPQPSQDYLWLNWMEEKLGGKVSEAVQAEEERLSEEIGAAILEEEERLRVRLEEALQSEGQRLYETLSEDLSDNLAQALQQAKDSGEFDGPQGIPGEKGETGQAGHTPVRGTDYWTEEDIAQIRSYVDDAILGGAW